MSDYVLLALFLLFAGLTIYAARRALHHCEAIKKGLRE